MQLRPESQIWFVSWAELELEFQVKGGRLAYAATADSEATSATFTSDGSTPLTSGGNIVTNDMVRALRDKSGG